MVLGSSGLPLPSLTADSGCWARGAWIRASVLRTRIHHLHRGELREQPRGREEDHMDGELRRYYRQQPPIVQPADGHGVATARSGRRLRRAPGTGCRPRSHPRGRDTSPVISIRPSTIAAWVDGLFAFRGSSTGTNAQPRLASSSAAVCAGWLLAKATASSIRRHPRPPRLGRCRSSAGARRCGTGQSAPADPDRSGAPCPPRTRQVDT